MSDPVVIVGGGPAGAATALYLARHGIPSTLVERDAFPRYHIGESLTGESAARLRELGLAGRMESAGYPVKRAVHVYGASGQSVFSVPVVARHPSGRVPSSTWQVRRDEFDAMLLDEARARGVRVIRGRAVTPVVDAGVVRGVHVEGPDGARETLGSRMLVDASGQAGFLARTHLRTRMRRGRYDSQVSVFVQVEGARRAPADRDDTLIFVREPLVWAWWIPLAADRISIGVTVPADRLRGRPDAFLRDALETLNPALASRVRGGREAGPVRTASEFSYSVAPFSGPGFLCVGDSHRFVDPVFSFGVHFALHEGRLAADTIARVWAGEDPAAVIGAYEARCTTAMDAIEDLIRCFWAHPLPFTHIVHRRHVDELRDLFAGRVYDEQPSAGLDAIRALLRRGGPSPAGERP